MQKGKLLIRIHQVELIRIEETITPQQLNNGRICILIYVIRYIKPTQYLMKA